MQRSVTHEYLAVMLAARRPGVSVAMSSLKRAGALDYHRGRMTVLDRAALEAACCRCHANTAAQFTRRDAVAVTGLPPQNGSGSRANGHPAR